VEVAGLLGIDLTQPVLYVRLVITDATGAALEISDTFYRADRYRYETETRLPRARRRQKRSRHGQRHRSVR
jgi:hypothetical protein